MEHMPLLFSLLFFAVFTVYLFLGVHTIYINSKANLNKMFLLVCISLCLWSFGFSMANSASNIESCLLWRRISAIGWASIYSLLLHFFILITNEKKAIRHWRYCLLLYIPAAINMYVFSLSKNMTAIHYHLVKMDYGWVNIATHDIWDFIFYFYYAGSILASMGIVWSWKRKSNGKGIHEQANIILVSILVALLLGSLTDIILNSYLTTPLPQMAPLFTLIPISAVYYSIKHNSLLQKAIKNENNSILDNITRARLYYYLSIVYLAGGLFNFIFRFLSYMIHGRGSISFALYSSGLFFILGLVILISQSLKNKKTINLILMTVILFSIPAITLMFLRSASITIWIFPIALIIVSLVFNTRTPLILITAVSILTQIILWIYVPKKMVSVDEYDYILRIGIFIIAFWIGSIVNQIYIKRLKESIDQTNFQKLISEISADFVSVNRKNIDTKINHMLYKIGQFFNVDRSYVILFNHQQDTLTCTHEWCRQGIKPEKEAIKDTPASTFSWLRDQLKNNRNVYINDINELPSTADGEKNELARQKVKSHISVPVQENKNPLGLIGLDSVVSYKRWSGYHTKLLKILTNILADGLIKVKAEKEIERMAYYDYLTGLPNRTLFSDRLNQALHLAKRNERFIGVMFMDLDGFKAVNDTMGHSAGDKLIKDVGHNLVQGLRKTDTVARFGGDEFLILINNLPHAKDIIKVADTIMGLFRKPFHSNGREFFVTASIGVAVYPYDGEDAETIIKNADIAMYRAKAGGKNQYVLCTVDMKEEVKKNMILSNSLYRAQERNELFLYYQPQVSLQKSQITGLEALLRWKHPEMGMIPPGIFIPLAEKNGLINSIGTWVLKTAISQNKAWQDMGLPHLRVAVNISIVQFNNPQLVSIINNILQETGMDPRYLELEITESAATKQAEFTAKTLNKLKELGVTISIDDFGTEYSSLNRLKILPIDRIKIDMQFIQGIEKSEKDQAITKVIINLAKNLGMKVLAEGVETAPQLEFLNQGMCDDVQGYFCYKPLPAEEIEELLKSSMNKRLP